MSSHARESEGERIIRTFLERHHITFQQNYCIQANACLPPYVATGRLYIDFVIYRTPSALNVLDPDQRNGYIVCAIEYDGHSSHFDNKRQMSRDRLKTHWCHALGIPLRRLYCEPAGKHAHRIENLIEHFLTRPYGTYREAQHADYQVGCPCTPREKYRKAQKWYDLDVQTTVPRPCAPCSFLDTEIGEEPRALALARERKQWAIVPYVKRVPWSSGWRTMRGAWVWLWNRTKMIYKRNILGRTRA